MPENWIDELGDLRDELDGMDVEIAAGILRDETFAGIRDRGGDYQTCYRQSVGNFVLVQYTDSPEDRAIFDAALDAAMGKVREWAAARVAPEAGP